MNNTKWIRQHDERYAYEDSSIAIIIKNNNHLGQSKNKTQFKIIIGVWINKELNSTL
jgi:hypothetical protein